MSKLYIPKHKIQLYVINVLTHQKYARFIDMRPQKADTNLYSYHLKVLLRERFVVKTDQGYTLDTQGLTYVDRANAELINVHALPKVITMCVVQNSNGDILLTRHKRQPFIDLWTLPYENVHIDDTTVEKAARRGVCENLGMKNVELRQAGDCYIRIVNDQQVIMSTLVHIFRFETDNIIPSEALVWARPHRLNQYELAPAMEEIVTRVFFNDPHFFEEYEIELST